MREGVNETRQLMAGRQSVQQWCTVQPMGAERKGQKPSAQQEKDDEAQDEDETGRRDAE